MFCFAAAPVDFTYTEIPCVVSGNTSIILSKHKEVGQKKMAINQNSVPSSTPHNEVPLEPSKLNSCVEAIRNQGDLQWTGTKMISYLLQNSRSPSSPGTLVLQLKSGSTATDELRTH